MKFPAVRYIPKASVKVADKLSDAVAYLYTSPKGNFGWVVYFGKQTKPVSNFQARSESARNRDIAEKFASRQATLAYKAKYAAERKAYVNDYKVGEILKSSWGYDQTNVDFYEVTESKGQMVTIRKIAGKEYETASMQGQVGPLPGQFIGDPMVKRAQEYGIKLTSYSSATRAEFSEPVPGVKVYKTYYTSSDA